MPDNSILHSTPQFPHAKNYSNLPQTHFLHLLLFHIQVSPQNQVMEYNLVFEV